MRESITNDSGSPGAGLPGTANTGTLKRDLKRLKRAGTAPLIRRQINSQ